MEISTLVIVAITWMTFQRPKASVAHKSSVISPFLDRQVLLRPAGPRQPDI